MAEDWTLFEASEASRAGALRPTGTASAEYDAGLVAVVEWFRRHDLESTFGAVLRQSIDEVLDGVRTGRFDIQASNVAKTEKTYLGTKVEIVTRAAFELATGAAMDYSVAGHDIDAKFSLRGTWSIPTEAMGHLCLLMTADDARSTFKVGVVRISPDTLNAGQNKDGKKTLSDYGRTGIVWLVAAGRLPPNQLLQLSADDRDVVLNAGSGQQRVTELLRRVRGRIIDRTTASTVARQRDPMKRCRDARTSLAPEGIVVLGHQNDSPLVAAALHLPVPQKGEFLSVRLVTAPDVHDGRPVATIAGRRFVIPHLDEPVEPAPPIRY